MKAWILAVAAASVVSCGGDSDKKTTETVVYGSLKTSLLDSTSESSYSLTQATCSNDSNSGLFTASFAGESSSKLEVRIKGFSTQAKTYTCTQSSDNVDGDVGQRFDSCMVEITIPDAATGLNTYAMYRSADSVRAFTYAGTCKVTTEYAAPKVTLTVDCGNLIQTIYQSAARNPIDASVTANVNNTTSVSCNI